MPNYLKRYRYLAAEQIDLSARVSGRDRRVLA